MAKFKVPFADCRLEIRPGPREHGPPHFHVVTKEVDASFFIHTLAPKAGKLRGSVGGDALKWAAQNQRQMIEVWDQMHAPRKKAPRNKP
jgi:hypothetical protein